MRRWLARKLCPEVFREADRHDYVQRRMSELRQWCGYDFPEIAVAVDWVARSERVHSMSLAEYGELMRTGQYNDVAVGDIDRFRTEIRRRFGRGPDSKASAA